MLQSSKSLTFSNKVLIRISIQPSKIIIDPDPSQTGLNYRLSIDRYNCKIVETKEKCDCTLSTYALIGLVKLSTKTALIYVEEAEIVGVMDNQPIYQVLKCGSLCLENKDHNEQEGEICSFFQKQFYFSYGIDLTKGEDRFFWNRHLIKSFPEVWQTRFIQGYVGCFQSTMRSIKKIQYFLISRRSVQKGGSFTNDTGIDQYGNAANHVESEQIIQMNNKEVSCKMVSGSIPLFWSQDVLNGQVQLLKDMETQRKGVMLHMVHLQKSGKKIHIVNLAEDQESELNQYLERLLGENKWENVSYNRVKLKDIFNDKVLMQYYKNLIDFTSVNQKQQTIIRITCVDGLDQINIVMCKLMMMVGQRMMEGLGIDLMDEFNSRDLYTALDQPSLHHLHPFLIYFKQKWAENGEYLKKSYKIGQENGSLKKFYQNMLEEKLHQDVIDKILGIAQSKSKALENVQFLELNMKKREQEYTKHHDISVYVVTWNLNAHSPTDTKLYAKLFDWQNQVPPTFIAVGFQELVKLNINNVVGNNNHNQVDKWNKIIAYSIPPSYIQVASQAMVGTFIMIFVQKSEFPNVSNCTSEICKYGFGQKLGNKGGVILRLRFYDSNIGFINVHLPAGQKNNEDRMAAFDYIHNKAELASLDWVITFGDMNFRVNLGYQRVVESLQQYNHSQIKEHREAILKQLRENDQLTQEKYKSIFLRRFDESEITFPPTYKFDIGTDIHDTVKRRVPSFTDRILHRKIQNIRTQYPVFYKCIQGPFQVSDHRPVCCYLKTQVCSVDEEKKDILFRQLIQVKEEPINPYFQRIEIVKNFDQCIKQRARGSIFKSRVTFDATLSQTQFDPFPD